MKKIVCVFCRQTSGRAKEHLWPIWLQEFLSAKAHLYNQTHYSFAGQPISRRSMSSGSLVSGGICASCNNGWMSGLENEASPLLKRLLNKQVSVGTILQHEEVNALARWAFKTAIVRNYASNYRSIVPDSHFQYLHDNRAIHEQVFIDLAVASHQGFGAVQSQQMTVLVSPPHTGSFKQAVESCYNIVLGIEDLVFRVAYLPLSGYAANSNLVDGRQFFRLHPYGPTERSFQCSVVTDLLEALDSACFTKVEP